MNILFFLRLICHFDEGEISARNSAKIYFDCRATYEDFSFVEMTNYPLSIVALNALVTHNS